VSATEREEWGHLRRSSQPRGQADLIGGISSSDHYQTTSQRQMNGVKTSSEQLTLVKQPTHRKVINDPAQATAEMRYRDSYAADSPTVDRATTMGGGANGFGYKPQAMGGSLIKNMGSSLLSRVDPPPSHHSASATSHKTPSAVEKTLISENFNSTPGDLTRLSLRLYSPSHRLHWPAPHRLTSEQGQTEGGRGRLEERERERGRVRGVSRCKLSLFVSELPSPGPQLQI
jgi:hypothetical protein